MLKMNNRNVIQMDTKVDIKTDKNKIIVCHHLNVETIWFSLIKDGQKTVEGRSYTDCRKALEVGHAITFHNDSNTCNKRIVGLIVYKDIESMLISETLSACLPGVTNLEDGIEIYKKYINESAYEVLAIRLA